MADIPFLAQPTGDPSTQGPTFAPPQPLPTQNATTNATIPSQPGPTAPQPSFAPPQAPPPNKHEILGRTMAALMGHQTSYSVGPDGKTVETQTPSAPGTLFKSILAGALLGGAAGANGNPAQGFAGGVARGGAATVEEAQKQDLIKRQQAQQEFQDTQRANQDKRESDAAVTEEQLRKAQIAHANAETLRTNVLTQGESYKTHSDVAAVGKQHLSDYDAAGLNPVMKDVSESDMNQTIKERPGAAAFDWEPTGVKTTVGDDGTPHYEYQYTAYDPKGKVPVSQGTIDQWKKDGMDKYYPELFDILKANKPLDAQQYIELKRKDSQLFNDSLTRQKAALATADTQSQINQRNAEAGKDAAEASRARLESGKIIGDKKDQQAMSAAFTELDTVGGDFSKLKPSSRVRIGESYSKILPSLSAEIRSAQAEGDDTKVHELMGELDNMRHLATQAMSGQGAPAAGTAAPVKTNIPPTRYDAGIIQKAQSAIASMPKDQALAAINSSTTMSEAEKITLRNQLNGSPQAAATESNDLPNASAR